MDIRSHNDFFYIHLFPCAAELSLIMLQVKQFLIFILVPGTNYWNKATVHYKLIILTLPDSMDTGRLFK